MKYKILVAIIANNESDYNQYIGQFPTTDADYPYRFVFVNEIVKCYSIRPDKITDISYNTSGTEIPAVRRILLNRMIN